jgi:hypothetical protein
MQSKHIDSLYVIWTLTLSWPYSLHLNLPSYMNLHLHGGCVNHFHKHLHEGV